MSNQKNTIIFEDANTCPIVHVLRIISGKWVIPIICTLNANKVMRYGALRDSIVGITNMMLTQSLKDLEAVGLIDRKQFNEIPPHTEYSLTDSGVKLMHSLHEMGCWSIDFCDNEEFSCANKCCSAHVAWQFKDKRAVLTAFFETLDNKYFAAYEQISADPKYKEGNFKYKFMEVLLSIIKILSAEDEVLSRVVSIHSFSDPEAAHFFNDRNRKYFQMINELIREGREQRVLREDLDDDTIIRWIAVIVHGIISEWDLCRGEYDITKRDRDLLEAVIDRMTLS